MNEAASGQPRLWIGTIYELTQETLGYKKRGRDRFRWTAVTDASTKRILIEQTIDKVVKEPRIVLNQFLAVRTFRSA